MTNAITADNITDEQICDIRAQAARNYDAYGLDTSIEVVRTCDRAIAHWGSNATRIAARARCAEILNARAASAPVRDVEDDLLDECDTCLGVGRLRDGETNELRRCLDCNGSGNNARAASKAGAQ